MLALIVIVILLVGIFAFMTWLSLRARKGRISATTLLGTNYELLNKDQRKAAEVIVDRNADKKTSEQDSSAPEHPGGQQ
jgi:hypothetical protein